MKKIVFVLTQSLTSPGGVGRFGPLARALVAKGYQVELYALHHDWENLEIKSFFQDGVFIKYVGQMHVQKKNSRKYYFKTHQLLWIVLKATIKLAWAIYKSDADIIQVCKAQPMNVLAARFGSRGRPLFCDCDDYEAETNNINNKWQKFIISWIEDSIVKDFKAISTNTRFSLNRYISLGFDAEKIAYLPNGVEKKRFSLKKDHSAATLVPEPIKHLVPNTTLIVYLGSLGILTHPVDLVLAAYKDVLNVIPNSHLIIIGGGEDFDKLIALSEELRIFKNTIFTGHVQASQIPHYLAYATVTIDPVYDNLIAKSRYPLKIIESLYMGVPVITSDVGDRRDILLNEEFGILIKPGDSQALAKALISLLNNDLLLDAMSKKALAYRKTWSWDRLVYQLINLYETQLDFEQ